MAELEIPTSAIEPMHCIQRAWEMFLGNPLIYIGMTILLYLIIGCIPILNIILSGPIVAGFYYACLKDYDEQTIEFQMLFKGFEKAGPLILAGCIMQLPNFIFSVMQYVVVFGYPELGNNNLYLAFLYGGIFLSSIWTVFLQFSLPLIIDRDLGVVEALGASIQAVLKNIGGMIVLMILQTLVVLVGVLALCVGVLAALPVALCAFAIAYRMMFPKIQEGEPADGPPPPTAYIPSSPY